MVNSAFATQFARNVSVQDCWFGALDGVENMEQLKARLKQRIDFYRSWVNGNVTDREPPESIRRTKTNIGEPISRTADCLRTNGMIKADVPLLVRLDQIEEMHKAFTERSRVLLLSFRKMLNRVFYSRDARVHYRAGTRRYGWDNPDFLSVWGSEARLENRRNYHLIEMDEEIFLLNESKTRQRNAVFERFAIDAFQKRVRYFFNREQDVGELPGDLAKTVFGKHPTAEERLIQLNLNADDKQIDRALVWISRAMPVTGARSGEHFFAKNIEQGTQECSMRCLLPLGDGKLAALTQSISIANPLHRKMRRGVIVNGGERRDSTKLCCNLQPAASSGSCGGDLTIFAR